VVLVSEPRPWRYLALAPGPEQVNSAILLYLFEMCRDSLRVDVCILKRQQNKVKRSDMK
jgi:hypothetical protein